MNPVRNIGLQTMRLNGDQMKTTNNINQNNSHQPATPRVGENPNGITHTPTFSETTGESPNKSGKENQFNVINK